MQSIQKIRLTVIESFTYSYFIHAGLFDALTTIIALGLGFFELNPIIASIYPDYIFLIPAILIAFAYLRGLCVLVLFKNKKYLKPMILFTLYFPGLFNLTGIIMFYLNDITIV